MNITGARVYVPAKDFAASQRYYRALGFTLTPGFGDTVDCTLGELRFRLQDYYVADWAGNFMFVVATDDARGWYARAEELIASGEHPGIGAKPPEAVEDDLVTHLVDPAGVLLVFVQSGGAAAPGS
ncbi:MAG: hypothetical protein KF773_11380 [Deltaproteobacteria bacterium]|nr:hypothetical protein [Deltaproteobacteria bacterium]MCW5808190.1 hypothetical protein [Deltaproteobacteria bacterium]